MTLLRVARQRRAERVSGVDDWSLEKLGTDGLLTPTHTEARRAALLSRLAAAAATAGGALHIDRTRAFQFRRALFDAPPPLQRSRACGLLAVAASRWVRALVLARRPSPLRWPTPHPFAGRPRAHAAPRARAVLAA